MELRSSSVLADAALEGLLLAEQFFVESKLGKGGMAWVYRGHRASDQSQVAIKVLFSQLGVEESFRQRFLREAQIQFQLQHAHIVRVYESFQDRGIVGFAMDWCNAGDLLQWLKQHRSPMSWGHMEQFFLPLLDALGYAHQRGVIHRDLKPQNILLHEQGGRLIPKLTDFGIAKIMDSAGLTKTGAMIGTLHYMSPEQVQESKSVDARTDIYSLGVLLYLLSTRHMPFDGQSTALLIKILQEEPRPPREAPALLQEVILRCLAKDPQRRYASCELLKADLIERFGSSSARIAMMIENSLPDSMFPAVRAVENEEFVSGERQYESSSEERKLPSGQSWPASFSREDHELRLQQEEKPTPPTEIIPTAPFSEETPVRSSSRGLVWVLFALSVCALLGAMYWFWFEMAPHPAPPTRTPTGSSPEVRTPVTKTTAVGVVTQSPDSRRDKRKTVGSDVPPHKPPQQAPSQPRAIPSEIVDAEKRCRQTKESSACWQSGEYWFAGEKQPREAQKARDLLGVACDAKHTQACVFLAVLWLRGQGGEQQEERGRTVLRSLCRRGSRDACFYLAQNRHTRNKYPRARKLYQQACRDGHVRACLFLAELWSLGLGGRKNLQRAGELYRQACLLGEFQGCNRLGIMIAKEWIDPPTSYTASSLFSTACEKNMGEACLNLGFLLVSSTQEPKLSPQAMTATTKACQLGHSMGCFLAGVLAWRHKNTPELEQKAEALFDKACQLRHTQGCLTLGWIYSHHQKSQNCGKANLFLQKACQIDPKICLKCPAQEKQRETWQTLKPRWIDQEWQQQRLIPR